MHRLWSCSSLGSLFSELFRGNAITVIANPHDHQEVLTLIDNRCNDINQPDK